MEPIKLTARQQQILELIQSAIANTGSPPTRAEIAAELGFDVREVFLGNFVRLDSGGKRAVVQLLLDLTTGGTGLSELN